MQTIHYSIDMIRDETRQLVEQGVVSKPTASPLRQTTPQQLRRYTFATGSMGPKVEAACRFVKTVGGYSGIGRLQDAAAILAKQTGTIIEDSEA